MHAKLGRPTAEGGRKAKPSAGARTLAPPRARLATKKRIVGASWLEKEAEMCGKLLRTGPVALGALLHATRLKKSACMAEK